MAAMLETLRTQLLPSGKVRVVANLVSSKTVHTVDSDPNLPMQDRMGAAARKVADKIGLGPLLQYRDKTGYLHILARSGTPY